MKVIAIDGPAGSGKSTVARRLAERLGLEYLDTGAMYRGVTFAALRRGIDPADPEPVAQLAKSVELEVADDHVRVDDVDASIEIRGPEVSRAVSLVAANPGISASDMAKKMNIKPNYLYRVLADLEKQGKVRKDGRAYRPAKG